MKQIYIHIGLHKTGSTYIQKVFTENRDILRESGIDYPELGAEFLFGHHNIAWSLMPGRALQNTNRFSTEQLLKYFEESPFERFLISSEDFDFLQSHQVEKLHRLLSNYQVEIVMYARNPVEAVYSRWQEGIKHGETKPLKDYCEQIAINPKPLDYCRTASTWTNVFGADAVTIVIYDNLVAKKVDVALYFLRNILEIEAKEDRFLLPKAWVNPSNDAGVIEALRQLNEVQKFSEQREKVMGSLITFLEQSVRGKALKQHLKNIYDESPEFIDIQPLKEVFNEISTKFLLIHKQQTKNTYNDRQLFVNKETSDRSTIRTVKPEAISKSIDIKKLYKLLQQEQLS